MAIKTFETNRIIGAFGTKW